MEWEWRKSCSIEWAGNLHGVWTYGGDGSDTASYEGSATWVSANLNGGSWSGDAAWDTLVNIENLTGSSHSDYLTGNGIGNVLTGADGNDTLDGYAGNDTLLGGLGTDSILGGEGADSAEGGDGNDSLYGWTGNDTLAGNAGDDYLGLDDGDDIGYGGEGADTIFGWNGLDTLDGGAGADYLSGEGDNDLLIGGLGADSLFGGAGSDVFKIVSLLDSTTTATDAIQDFVAGSDIIDIRGFGFTGIESTDLPQAGKLGLYQESGVYHLTDGADFDLIISSTGAVTATDILYNG